MTTQFNNPLLTAIQSLAPQMKALLVQSLKIPSVSGDEKRFVEFIHDYATSAGFTSDLWQPSESELGDHPVARAKHIPLANRPTLVVGLPSSGSGRSLLFNAHSDVVSAGNLKQWNFGPWSGDQSDGKIYGRGACDVKGPLISALWSMLAIKQVFPDGLPGLVQLELVPGEEDCVTLGTLTSVSRGYTADACVVLEPTECQPRNASRPGLRFEILCLGRAVHGTVKWLGEDAIELAQQVLGSLKALENKWNDPEADPYFRAYPIARPITVDTVKGGEWQGMICDECRVAGYLELLPNDPIEDEIGNKAGNELHNEPVGWKQRFTSELLILLQRSGIDGRRIKVTFPETYSGHRLESAHSLCKTAESIVKVSTDLSTESGKARHLTWNGWSGFNSGCEAGLRAHLLKTPTLVWGPGSLAQAHSADEFVEFEQVQQVANLFAQFALAWTSE